MKSKGILFLATLAILVMTLASAYASTSSFYATAGDDQTPSAFPNHYILTPSDLSLMTSNNGAWYRTNGTWYWQYQDMPLGVPEGLKVCKIFHQYCLPNLS